MAGGFDYRAFQEFAERFGEMEQHFDQFINGFMLQMGMRLLRKVKPRTPVDTGDLRNHWELSEVFRQGDDVCILLINPLIYASFVEYGHRQEVGRFVSAIGARLVNPWVEGYFMATISIQEIEREIPKRFEVEFKRYYEGLVGA